MVLLILFLIGLAIGSFVNVCIWRIPQRLSIIFPGSHCPNCSHPLKWYDNIPVISFLVLKGKCRYCQTKISFQYPVIELLTAILLCILFIKFGFQEKFLVSSLLTIFLVIVSGIDWKHKIIPDVLTYPLMIIGVVSSFFNPLLAEVNLGITHLPVLNSLLYSLISLVVSGGILYLISLLGDWIFSKETMGGGDIKLIAAIGSLIGIQNIVWTIFIASLLGGTIGGIAILLKLKKPQEQIPFGPYLSLGTFLTIIFQEKLIQFYNLLF